VDSLSRIIQGSGQSVFVNGDLKAGSGGVGNFTVYVNPYLVVQSGQYSKHYFIESQRITTRLELGWQQQVSAPAAVDTIANAKKEKQLLQGIARDQQAVQGTGQQQVTAVTGPDARGVANSNGQAGGNGNGTTGGSADSTNNGNRYAYGHYKGHTDTTNQSFLYFYHPDHLGSTSYVTDDAGEVYEHMEYFAFGETFVQEHSNTDRIPYLFNAKELDEETGLYYYGARYFDPRTSIFESVDPMANKYPGLSSYAYTRDNPINYNDPDGRDGVKVVDKDKKTLTVTAHYDVQSGPRTYGDGHKLRTMKGYSAKEIAKMQEKYNKYLNKLNLTVSEGEYQGYSIKFNLTFEAGGTPDESEQRAKTDMQDGHPVGNAFTVANDVAYARFKTNEHENADGTISTSTVGGVTGDHKNIMMNVSQDTKMNRIHEIFHTFGFDHPAGIGGAQGIMKYPPDKPSQADANHLANGNFLPAVNAR
jgi:RHS repeat-associated protein